MKYISEDLKKLPKLIFGFWVLALGLVMMRKADLGLNAWGVFHDGLAKTTGISFGQIIQLVGIIILLLSFLIKIYPGVGTILNILFIGLFVDWMDLLVLKISFPDSLLFNYFLLFIGLVLNTYGTALYIMCELGKGPRDGLFIGLTKLTGISVKYIRPIIEFIVLGIGFLLGGVIAIGTIIITLASGYLVNYFFTLHRYDPKAVKQRQFKDYLQKKVKIVTYP